MLERLATAVNPSGLSQRWRATKQRIYRDQVAFVHVPKSGGTSVSHIFRGRYILSQCRVHEEESRAACSDVANDEWMRFKQRLVRYHLNMKTNFVQGHFPVDRKMLDDFADDVRFITVLREPISRVISHYHFDSRLRAMPFSEFLASERGRVETSVLRRFFGEAGWQGHATDASTVTARENLERFALVGTLEAPWALREALKQTFKLSASLPRRNETRCGGERAEQAFAPSDLAILKEMCAGDLEIYEAFRSHDP